MTPSRDMVLSVYKEVSWTSHDAVDRVRRILGERRVGHAGSLDPLASGVLVVGVGRCTKLLPYLMELGKSYRGTFVFGRRTTTADSGGATVEEGPVPQVDAGRVQAEADTFVGISQQVPPMVSAIKQQGKRLYSLARRGVEVPRLPRAVEIHRFRILAVELPRVDFELDCGKGTYVRALVEDLATRLGALATVESLIRTAVGPFHVHDACRLIADPCRDRAGLRARGISPNAALDHLPVVLVAADWIHRIRQGGMPPRSALQFDGDVRPEGPVRMMGPEQELLALARWEFLPGPADRPGVDAGTLRLERVI